MKDLVNINENGKPVTNSLLVAQEFGKKHFHVLDAVKNLLSSHEKSCQFFESTVYVDSSGKENQMYIMTRDGFMLLVMGFTGKEALAFKFEFIDAFNQMEEFLIKGKDVELAQRRESARLRGMKSNRVHEIDMAVSTLMSERRQLVKEINQIDRSDYLQLTFPFGKDRGISLGFVHKRIS